MRRAIGWKIIVVALGSATGVEAQSLPPSCYALDASLEPDTAEPAYGPWLTRWPDSLAGTLGRSFYHISPGRADSIARLVDTWWRSDSVALEWALATVIVDPQWTPDLAVNAAAEYRRHSGRAGPILRRGADLGNSPRTEMALSAVTGPLDDREQSLVFRLACHAAWPLIMLRHDAQYREFAWQNAGSLGWIFGNQATLKQAERLLTGRWREAAIELSRVADIEAAR